MQSSKLYRNIQFSSHTGNIQIKCLTYICSVNGWRPPQCEASVWNLVETRALSICQFLVFHGLLKAAGLLPEQTLPGGKVGALEQGVL